MKEFIVKHIEEFIGALLGMVTGFGIKMKMVQITIFVSFLSDLHTVLISLLSGIAGGVGALLVKIIWHKIKSRKDLKKSER